MQTTSCDRLLVKWARVVPTLWLISSCVVLNAGPVGIGWTPHGAETTAGYIAPDGHLILFDGGATGWTFRPSVFPHALVPGGPIALMPESVGDVWPTVITVSPAH